MTAVNTTFNDLITFTRASTGTFVGSNGLVQTAATNTPRFGYNPTTLAPLGFLIEEQRTNLVLYSEQSDNAVWTLQRVTVTPNTDVAPDGTTTADLTTGTGASGGAMGTNQTVSASASTAYTISGFFKAGTSTWVILTGFDGTTSPRAWFNLISGTIGSVETGMTNATIQNYGNGWYRCSVVRTTGAAATSLRWQMSHSTGNDTTATSATLTLTVWGAQLEAGAFSTSYIPTPATFVSRATTGTFVDSSGLIATAAINVARNQYNPANLSAPPFLLLEAAAENKCTYSQDFTSVSWSVSGATKTTGISDPAGGVTAATGTATVVGGNIQNSGAAVVIGTTYTVSIWMRRRTGTGAVGIRAVENANIPVTITSTWARYSLTVTATQTIGRVGVYCSTIGDEIDFWGAQLELGTYPTSYFPTTTTALTRAADISTSATGTRAADVATINTLSPWYNATEGTLFAQAISTGYVLNTNFPLLTSIDNGTASNRITVFQGGSSNSLILTVRSASTSSTIGDSGVDLSSTPAKVAGAYSDVTLSVSANGNAAINGTSLGVPSGLTIMRLGSSNGLYLSWLNGYLQKVIYYPRRLTNSELQSLTA